MKQWIRIGLMILIFTIVMSLTHEFVHAQIYEIYNCKNIHYGMNNFYTITTYAECPNLDNNLAQSINEIISYMLVPLIIIIIIVLGLMYNDE